MAIKGCVERIAQSLLSPKERLNPLLFDENDVMHEEVRRSLWNLHKYISTTFTENLKTRSLRTSVWPVRRHHTSIMTIRTSTSLLTFRTKTTAI